MRWMLWTVLWMSGCASHEVKCDAHLQPINAPMPRASHAAPAVGVPAAAGAT